MEILYKAKRIGKNGVIFNLYKFRTMIRNADKLGGSSTADDDKRITKLGYWLRKTKLDELPQIINLLKGDITLIGWRPESPEYLNTIPLEVLKTKPGLIGLATLEDFDEGSILKGSTNPDKDYEEKILPLKRELELKYVREKSLFLDLKIICKTLIKTLQLLFGNLF